MKLGIDLSNLLVDEKKRVKFLESLGSKKCECGFWVSKSGLERWDQIKEKVRKEFPNACCERYVQQKFDADSNLAKQILAKRKAALNA